MQDAELLASTASEALTMDEERQAQQQFAQGDDRLRWIILDGQQQGDAMVGGVWGNLPGIGVLGGFWGWAERQCVGWVR